MANEQIKEIIKRVESGEKKPSLLLHCCCAPCASSVAERLLPFFDLTLFFYNPNIYPLEEYLERLKSMRHLAEQCLGVKLIEDGYDYNSFLQSAKGLESEKEGGKRCDACFALRLQRTAELAKDYDYFATTLTVGPQKNVKRINEIGKEVAALQNSVYLSSDFKKEDGFLQSIQLSKKYGLYRQNYCGCSFSKR